MARSGVTFSEVEDAIRYLQGLGRSPTVDAIREHLGTGSRTTLAEHLKRWRALQTGDENRLPQPLLAMLNGLWDSLQSRAVAQVDDLKILTEQEVATLHAQLHTQQQREAELRQTLHQLQETSDEQSRTKTELEAQLLTLTQSRDKLDTLYQTSVKQLEEAKQENQRLHKLAQQIQTNLEHYQQSIQQLQLEHTLTNEKQQANYAQELKQLKMAFEKANRRAELAEKTVATTQQAQTDHDALLQRFENLMTKYQETERTNIQLQTNVDHQQKQLEKGEQNLVDEQHLTQSLQQEVTVLTEQLTRAHADLKQADNKIEILREEKLFLVQEKANLEGALKVWQTKNH